MPLPLVRPQHSQQVLSDHYEPEPAFLRGKLGSVSFAHRTPPSPPPLPSPPPPALRGKLGSVSFARRSSVLSRAPPSASHPFCPSFLLPSVPPSHSFLSRTRPSVLTPPGSVQVPLSFYERMCNNAFAGQPFNVTANVADTNARLGGNQLPLWYTTNIVYDNRWKLSCVCVVFSR